MRLLLDSRILLAIVRKEASSLGVKILALLDSPYHEKLVSAASLWEISIKHRLGKLRFDMQPHELPNYFLDLGYALLQIDHRHAIERIANEPSTRDPFDHLMLAQCQVEGMRLVTLDRALANHPLIWREK